MFDELKKYKETDHFFLKPNDSLTTVCNVPANKSGVYIIFALKNGRIELVKIGCSNDNEGIKDQIIKEQLFIKSKIKQENIEALDIYWYVTHTAKASDDPHKVKDQVLRTHNEIYGHTPRWNRIK
ncbi:MAG TPA: hypothetical protein VMV74_00650 [Bacteroidales bacterium]|nr:hypothetical protein [Bacteroidales bacterium]